MSQSSREVAKVVAATFGGEFQVNRYYDEKEENSIDILECADRPTPGLTSYSTVTLHAAPNLLDGADVRVEQLGVAPTSALRYPSMLCHAALCVTKQNWLCAPGVIFPDLLAEYDLSQTLSHVIWVPPFLWDELGEVEITPDLKVHWLLAFPISDAERAFVEQNGFYRFEKLLEDADVACSDLGRESLV